MDFNGSIMYNNNDLLRFLQKKKYHYLQLKANSDITTDGEK